MGHIVIRFTGIAVHIDRDTFPPLQPRHRVIFISQLRNPPPGIEALPHELILLLPEAQTIDLPCVEDAGGQLAYNLRGVSMQVLRSTGRFTPDESYKSYVPRLAEKAGVLPPDEGVILHHQEPAAAYFDIEHGMLAACLATKRGAIGTHLVVETEDERPQLELRCFDDPDATATLEFESGSVLTLLNVAEGGIDTDDDFVLSYEVCSTIPPEGARVKPVAPDTPPPTSCIVADDSLPLGHIDFGAGCSNSGYP